MSAGNANQENIPEPLIDEMPTGKLDDAEIQRLVALSNDASFERTDRVPVKSVEVFEPRSLVSIAMAAQRRRASEIRTAESAGAFVEVTEETELHPEAPVPEKNKQKQELSAESQKDSLSPEENITDAAPIDENGNNHSQHGEQDEQEALVDQQTEESSSSRVDFEAGRIEGIEEGRQLGIKEGEAKGLEEGRAAGRAEASAQLERSIQAFENATSRLQDLTAVDSDALGESISSAVKNLASQRAGIAIAEFPQEFADRVEALLSSIRIASGNPIIRLNPSDYASIQPLVETREKLRGCYFVADPMLSSGDLSVMVGTVGIDDIMIKPTTGPSANKEPRDSVADFDTDNNVASEASTPGPAEYLSDRSLPTETIEGFSPSEENKDG